MTDFEIKDQGAPGRFVLTVSEPSGLTMSRGLSRHDLTFLEDSCAASLGDSPAAWSPQWGDEPARVGDGIFSLEAGGMLVTVPVSRRQIAVLRERCHQASERGLREDFPAPSRSNEPRRAKRAKR